MPAIWTPPAIIEPAVVDSVDIVEIFCDGGVIRVREGLIETLCYRAHAMADAIQFIGVARIWTPVSGFDQSMHLAYWKRLGRGMH